MLHVYVDADGCPVKDEIYRVAKRYGLKVTVVANARLWVPTTPGFKLVIVTDAFDAADDWIAEHAGHDDIVVTADIPLAARCLKKQARVIGPRGRVFTESSIGDALASRDVSQHLRDMGTPSGGPAPLDQRDRSSFLQRLDDVIQAVRRGKTGGQTLT